MSQHHTPRTDAAESLFADSILSHCSPAMYLEICRGETQFPCRPVWGSRFLIGAGENCDLRLGGAEMPPVHSVIRNNGVEVWLEAVASRPTIQVNGRPECRVQLRDGDVIRIGAFRFIARFLASVVAVSQTAHDGTSVVEPAQSREPAELEDEPFSPDHLAELSAEELVDLIERDQALVAEMESGRRRGGAALWSEVASRAAAMAEADDAETVGVGASREPTASASPEADILFDLEQMLREITAVSETIEARARRLTRREASLAETAERVLDAQQELTARLESLLGRLSQDARAQRRASA